MRACVGRPAVRSLAVMLENQGDDRLAFQYSGTWSGPWRHHPVSRKGARSIATLTAEMGTIPRDNTRDSTRLLLQGRGQQHLAVPVHTFINGGDADGSDWAVQGIKDRHAHCRDSKCDAVADECVPL